MRITGKFLLGDRYPTFDNMDGLEVAIASFYSGPPPIEPPTIHSRSVSIPRIKVVGNDDARSWGNREEGELRPDGAVKVTTYESGIESYIIRPDGVEYKVGKVKQTGQASNTPEFGPEVGLDWYLYGGSDHSNSFVPFYINVEETDRDDPDTVFVQRGRKTSRFFKPVKL